VGYDCQWQVLNSLHFGLPQNRQRVYIVGHLRGTPRPEVFPIRHSGEEHHLSDRKGKHVKIKEATKLGYAIASYGDSIDVSYPNSLFRRGRVGKGYSHTLITRTETCTLSKDGRIRRLTPLECERVQGFPDEWTRFGSRKGEQGVMSDAQRYKCLGNAVGVPVIAAIIKRLMENPA
jgi:DNA (cytosine-5)-methyltransferase 1